MEVGYGVEKRTAENSLTYSGSNELNGCQERRVDCGWPVGDGVLEREGQERCWGPVYERTFGLSSTEL